MNLKNIFKYIIGILGFSAIFSCKTTSVKQKPQNIEDKENSSSTDDYVKISQPVMYGMPPNIYGKVYGKVNENEEKIPLEGIKITIKDEEEDNSSEDVTIHIKDEDYILTDKNGTFILFTGSGKKTVTFEDIDEDKNGKFKTKQIKIDSNKKSEKIDITLEKE